ncbi:MAG TPA: hypothetical protein VGR57_09955, partial [Ktedonobacterales bacterium]|nr:hypothetical protein [Ktedonobacterales bacterium]
MPQETPLYTWLAAAHVRGRLATLTPDALPTALRDTPLVDLGEEQLGAVIAAGQQAGLRLHHFKRT